MTGLATAGWLALLRQVKPRRWFLPLLGFLLTADLLWFAYGRSAQCDWSLNFPQNPVLREVAEAKPPGRIIPMHWLSATLAQTQGLRRCSAATTPSIRRGSSNCSGLPATRNHLAFPMP